MKPSITVLLDIGNTAVTCGLVKNGRISSIKSLDFNIIPKLLKNCSKSGKYSKISVVLESVVPYFENELLIKFKQNPTFSFHIAGKNLSIPMKSRYQPRQLGIDRLVNAYGCTQLHGKPPFVILDYGTALTADYVSSKGVFEGGLIIPGPVTSFKALNQKGALLPSNLKFPSSSKGVGTKNTRDALQSGILEAYGAMTDGLVDRFRNQFGKELKVVATGGLSKVMAKHSNAIDILDPQLSLKTLFLLYKTRSVN